MHRFFAPADIRTDATVVLGGPQAHQIARVLRLRAGEEIILVAETAGGAVEWRVRLDAVEAKAARGTVIAERPGARDATCAVTLCAAVLKGERFDWLLQKATEVGVAFIRPVVTERTIRRTRADDTSALERWRRIVTEAAEQSGRGRVPEIHPPVALRDVPLVGRAFVAHEAVQGQTLSRAVPADADTATLLIGPEGGFAEEEIRALIARGALPVSLGPTILRAETAAIIAVTLAHAATGDLEPPEPRAWVVASPPALAPSPLD